MYLSKSVQTCISRELGYRSQIQSSQKNGNENESTIEWKEGEMGKVKNVFEVLFR